MNNTKSPKNVSLKNQLELWLFCALIGAVAGALVWILLKIMAVGTEFLWKWLPGKTSVPYYTILICVAGAAIIGIFRKIFGDYPEDLETVMGKVRTEKRYEYKNMLVMMVAALLPLLIGSSVGPEAGLTGIIVGLCYWAGDNLKFAKQNTRNYSQIGAAVSMSVRTRADKIIIGFIVFIFAIAAVIQLVEPDINRYGDALWYCYAVISTAGFGDVVAVTFIGKMCSVLLTIYSLFVVAIATGVVVNFYTQMVELQRKETLAMFMDQLERLPELSREELENISRKVRQFR